MVEEEEEITLFSPKKRPIQARGALDDGQDILTPGGVFGPLDGPLLDVRVFAV